MCMPVGGFGRGQYVCLNLSIIHPGTNGVWVIVIITYMLTRQGGNAGGPPVCIKPNEGGQGSGVACLRTPEDL